MSFLDLVRRTHAALHELSSCGGAPHTPEMVEILEKLSELNQDLAKGMDPFTLSNRAQEVKDLLDQLIVSRS